MENNMDIMKELEGSVQTAIEEIGIKKLIKLSFYQVALHEMAHWIAAKRMGLQPDKWIRFQMLEYDPKNVSGNTQIVFGITRIDEMYLPETTLLQVQTVHLAGPASDYLCMTSAGVPEDYVWAILFDKEGSGKGYWLEEEGIVGDLRKAAIMRGLSDQEIAGEIKDLAKYLEEDEDYRDMIQKLWKKVGHMSHSKFRPGNILKIDATKLI